jgi:septum formation protein
MPKSIILASGSPRRKQILSEAGIIFEVKTKPTPENYPSSLPVNQIAQYLAELKALAFADEIQDKTIIAADTIVVLNDNVLGKPSNFDEAYTMLKMLSGKEHEVITGVCILSTDKKEVFSDSTKVIFRELAEDEILHYINEYKPFDKAGGYGIQEWIGQIGIEKISGSYYNVMGLPIHLLYQKLQRFI